MIIQLFPEPYAICRLPDLSGLRMFESPFFLAVTGLERSLVCAQDEAPDNATDIETEYRLFGIQGTLDFSLVGIIAGISAALAGAEVPVFVVSTYETDYFLVPGEKVMEAAAVLRDAGYAVREGEAPAELI